MLLEKNSSRQISVQKSHLISSNAFFPPILMAEVGEIRLLAKN